MILAIDNVKEKFKVCPMCNKEKSINEFSSNKKYINGRSKWCIQCKREYERKYRETNREKIKQSNILRKEQYNSARRLVYENNKDKARDKLKTWYDNNAKSRMWSAAKRRAKEKGLPFNITKEDITIPEKCPVLNIDLVVGSGYAQENSPSLDRIIPSKGYVKDNIVVVSYKANTIKNNATIKELKQVYEFYKSLVGEED